MPYGRWRLRINQHRARVEMIPLMDCMFLLLSFFIYATMTMVVQKGIFVNLAKAQTGEVIQEEEKSAVTLSIDKAGNLFLDKRQVSERQLKERLYQFGKKKKNAVVLINADKEVTHEKVMRALDWVRQSGVTQVVFNVEPIE